MTESRERPRKLSVSEKVRQRIEKLEAKRPRIDREHEVAWLKAYEKILAKADPGIVKKAIEFAYPFALADAKIHVVASSLVDLSMFALGYKFIRGGLSRLRVAPSVDAAAQALTGASLIVARSPWSRLGKEVAGFSGSVGEKVVDITNKILHKRPAPAPMAA